MPETGSANIEVAQHLTHHEAPAQSGAYEMLEIIEALVLAVVAIATAWSGYEAALWDGRQSELYGEASKLRVQAEGIAREAFEEHMYTASTVGEWLKAEARGERKLAELFERRILPEFRPGFEAWKSTDPLNNPQARAGPFLTEEYKSAKTEEAARLNKEASEIFERGTLARHRADDYVRVTVFLATVLLLTAISQRFKIHHVRLGLTITSAVLLCLFVYRILTLPRI